MRQCLATEYANNFPSSPLSNLSPKPTISLHSVIANLNAPFASSSSEISYRACGWGHEAKL